MQIDWFTFGAQIVNFLILVWLLKRFLYGPIVHAMTEREQRIADRFEEAREKRETAEAEAAAYREKRDELEAVREKKIADAEDEARQRRQELIEEARAEVDRLEEQWREALRRERAAFLEDLAHRVSQETLALARRALGDLAHAELEQQVIRVFADRLDSLDDERRAVLADTVRSDDETLAVHTAFELDDEHRRRLTDALRAATDTDVTPTFDREADLGFGIEVRAGGHKVAWSLRSYFAEMEERVRARIEEEISRGGGLADGEGVEAQDEAMSELPLSNDP